MWIFNSITFNAIIVFLNNPPRCWNVYSNYNALAYSKQMGSLLSSFQFSLPIFTGHFVKVLSLNFSYFNTEKPIIYLGD